MLEFPSRLAVLDNQFLLRRRIPERLAEVIVRLEISLNGESIIELAKTLPKVAAEMALSVLAYNLTRVMNIVGTKPLMAAIGA